MCVSSMERFEILYVNDRKNSGNRYGLVVHSMLDMARSVLKIILSMGEVKYG